MVIFLSPIGGGFPGEKSPGLIEAVIAPFSCSSPHWMFPGEKSPGLIEARPRDSDGSRPGTSFRGRNPPASLKHVDVSVRSLGCGHLFPGEKSPGLIEAAVTRGQSPYEREVSVSGGEIPRPH